MKPFLKWAGGKKSLIKILDSCLPVDFETHFNLTYVEPFVGGGAMLFHMLSKYTNISRVIINDINKNLIEAYKAVKLIPQDVIRELKKLSDSYIALNAEERAEFFYSRRAEYNTLLLERDEKSGINLRRVSLFMFLNKTCFNGLYRVNAKGEFNVPHGRYVNPRIYNEEEILNASKLLERVEIYNGDFADVLNHIQFSEDVFMYIDPPYRPMSSDGDMFRAYDSSGFKDEDQSRVKQVCDRILQQDGNVMVSNSDSMHEGKSFFEELYEGYTILHLNATRFINPYNRRSSKAGEVLITNYEHNL